MNKTDILNAFRRKYRIDDDWDNELYKKIPSGYAKANPELEQWLLNALTEFEREVGERAFEEGARMMEDVGRRESQLEKETHI